MILQANFKEANHKIPSRFGALYTVGSGGNADVDKKFADINENFSNALKGNVSGSVVSAKDISPIEHTIKVNLTSDTITDFSGVQLKVYGKNLFNVSQWVGGEVTELNGVSCLKIKDHSSSFLVIEGSTDTAFKLNFRVYRDDGAEDKKTNLKSKGADGVEKSLSSNIIHNERREAVVYGGEKVYFIGWNTTLYLDLNITQLELGTTATKFEPYIEPVTYPVQADGTVKGLKYQYPSATIFTDSADAIVNLDYNRDINEVFAELKQAIITLGGTI